MLKNRIWLASGLCLSALIALFTSAPGGAAAVAVLRPAGGTPVSVPLGAAANVYGVGTSGTAVTGGGIDGHGDAFASVLLGASAVWSGATFTFAPAGPASAASKAVIPLTAASDVSLLLLATAVNGNQANQIFVVTYSDGTTTSFTQSISNWTTPQNYAGESTVLSTAYRVRSTGATQQGSYRVYGYSFALDSARTVQSLTLPANANVVVLAVDVTPATPAAAPTFSPPAGAFTATQSVALADATAGASIYYTTDGTTPTPASTLYNGPISVAATTTLEAIAVAANYTVSAAAKATYTINSGQGGPPISVPLAGVANLYGLGKSGTPVTAGGIDAHDDAYDAALLGTTLTWSGATFTFAAPGPGSAVTDATIPLPVGNYQSVSLLGAAVHGNQPNQSFIVTYGDGSTASFSQSVSDWSAPQKYAGESTVVAMADRIKSTGLTQSGSYHIYGYAFALDPAKSVKSLTLPANVYTAYVAIDLVPAGGTSNPTAAPTFSPAAGSFTGAQSVTIADATAGAAIYYTSDGSAPTTSSTKYSAPVSVATSETLQAIAIAGGHTLSPAASAAYTIKVATPVFSLGSGTYASQQTVSLSDATAGSKIYYTTNGSTPTTSSTLYTGAFVVSSTETVEAVAAAAGDTTSAVASATYTITPVTKPPVFSLAAGTYTTTQADSITDPTAGSAIYYTIDGTTPTTASTPYTGTLTVAKSETVKAVAVAPGDSVSAVASATYTIQPVVATPVFSPAPGTYSSSQTVTISDATSGAVIYYTTNGTVPTTSSTKYTSAISVSATETIDAIAVATGYTQSSLANGPYTIGSAAIKETTLYDFGSQTNDGKTPVGAIIQGSDGNFYGTTSLGGAYGVGAVFKITPAGTESVLYSFSGTINGSLDGAEPEAALIEGSDHNFYGTTFAGGQNNAGTVFKITPAGVETVLHSFDAGTEAAYPAAPLIIGSDGNFYGTTTSGSTSSGTVFKITPAGAESVIYGFSDLSQITLPLIEGVDLNYYGMTQNGGAEASGSFFRVTPAGVETTLYTFPGTSVTGGPTYPSAFMLSSDGNFYGTTRAGGLYGQDGTVNGGNGTVFKLTSGGAITILYNFAYGSNGSVDGASPYSLFQGSDGNFYGTTVAGGLNDSGTLFKLTPGGVETLLYAFNNGSIFGIQPAASMIPLTIPAPNGNFYGTTSIGGPNSDGTVFELANVIGRAQVPPSAQPAK